MRGRLRKKIVAGFEAELRAGFPQFLACNLGGRYPSWSLKLATNLYLFIGLQFFSGKDQFVVNLAWSENGEEPWAWLGRAEVEQMEGCQRLGVLWNRARGERHEYVWDLAPEKTAADEAHIKARARGEHLPYAEDPPVELLLPRIEPLVHDAIEKLEQYGIPLFRRVAEAHGVKWPEGIPAGGDPSKGGQ